MKLTLRYAPLFLKVRVIAAMLNPRKAAKRMTINPPTTPPAMAAILDRLSMGTNELLCVCVCVCVCH